jgi:hypothetical protein
MSVVRKLPRFSNPGSCIMFPGRTSDERGFYLFDTVVDGPHGDIQVGISGEGLRKIASQHGARFGIAKSEDVDKWRDLALELKNRVLELEEEVDRQRDFKEHLAGVAAEGFQIRRKVGRPAEKESK